ncbi:MAG: hypothetical protein HC822_24140 [Oscillochloris sp.]|nr:hypothetical protein [Oscillochloris sp.]
MPLVSRVMIRTALLHLALGVTIGGLLLAEKGISFFPYLWLLRPGHIQILLIGWTVQFALGVAIWIMPRFDAAGGRGNLAWIWLCYGALNGGVLLATLHTPLADVFNPNALIWMLPLGGVCYLIAVVAAVIHLWRRILPFRSIPRA